MKYTLNLLSSEMILVSFAVVHFPVFNYLKEAV